MQTLVTGHAGEWKVYIDGSEMFHFPSEAEAWKAVAEYFHSEFPYDFAAVTVRDPKGNVVGGFCAKEGTAC